MSNQSSGLEQLQITERFISEELYQKLLHLGIIDPTHVRSTNIGNSNYAQHLIQPWTIWLDYPELTGWDCDIVKRVLRTKFDAGYSEDEQRILDYEKIIHNAQERIRQLKYKK